MQIIKECKKYFTIWLRLTEGTTQIAFSSRLGAAIFIFGKLLRFVFFFFFILILFSKTKSIAGYTFWQMIFFFLTFNIIDTIPQFLFRDVYRFRGQIVNGYFDHVLLKPMSPLFKALLGGSDIFDLFIIVFLLIVLFVVFPHLGAVPPLHIVLYILLIINACLIALAFHIIVLCLGIITTEVDNTIMLYRDVTQMGRFPVEIYKEPVRGILTFVIPVGIMMTFPMKALFGLFTFPALVVAFGVSITLLTLSLFFWRYALKQYASASS